MIILNLGLFLNLKSLRLSYRTVANIQSAQIEALLGRTVQLKPANSVSESAAGPSSSPHFDPQSIFNFRIFNSLNFAIL